MADMARSPHIAAHLMRISRLVYWQHRVLSTVDEAWRRQAVETWRNLARALRTRDPRRAERAVNAVDRHSRREVLRIHRDLGPAVYRLFG